jgi:DNA polymerase-1
MVNSDMRRNAKAVNFGIVYGISEFSLAEDIHTTRAQAKEYMEKYLETYSGVRKFMKETVENAREAGYVKTLSGRRRYIPEISASNFNIRSFGERVALNAPIQGTAADIIKIAMILLDKKIDENRLSSKLLLTIHDELVLEVSKGEEEIIEKIVVDSMKNAVELSIPLDVSYSFGKDLYEVK